MGTTHLVIAILTPAPQAGGADTHTCVIVLEAHQPQTLRNGDSGMETQVRDDLVGAWQVSFRGRLSDGTPCAGDSRAGRERRLEFLLWVKWERSVVGDVALARTWLCLVLVRDDGGFKLAILQEPPS